MKLSAKQIAFTAMLLAVCMASQFFKNVSVYITGPVINAAIILAVIGCGLACGVILGVITPVTSFFITGSPVMAAVPAMLPCIMAGNIVLAVMIFALYSKEKSVRGFIGAVILGGAAKGGLMGLLISVILLPNFLPEMLQPMLSVLQMQFSAVQVITAWIGGVYAWILKNALKQIGKA